MTKTATVRSAAIIALKGAGKAQREAAYLAIAPLAMVETLSRNELVDTLRRALGSKPSEAEIKAAQQEVTIGRVAARLPASEFPKDAKDNASKLEHVRNLVCFYAAPPQDGKKPRALRTGQLGRRSIVQHKAIRAADEAWSQIKAELGLGTAQTQAQRNEQKAKAKRAPQASTVNAKPTHEELVKPGEPMTAARAHEHVLTQASLLAAFLNNKSNAPHICSRMGKAILAFKKEVTCAKLEYEEMQAKADAERAAKEK